MEAKEFYKYSKWCWENGIKFIPIPITSNGSVLKIAMIKERYTPKGNLKITQTIGEEKFTNETVYTRIKELYRQVFNNNHQSKIKQK